MCFALQKCAILCGNFVVASYVFLYTAKYKYVELCRM